MNRLEQLERLANGFAERRDDPDTQILESVVHYKREQAKAARPLSPGNERKLARREERQAAKQARQAAKWEVLEKPPTLYKPIPAEQRCQATTLAGHCCTLRAGHTEGHMGRLPTGIPLNPAAGITQWCRWERHSDDVD